MHWWQSRIATGWNYYKLQLQSNLKPVQRRCRGVAIPPHTGRPCGMQLMNANSRLRTLQSENRPGPLSDQVRVTVRQARCTSLHVTTSHIAADDGDRSVSAPSQHVRLTRTRARYGVRVNRPPAHCQLPLKVSHHRSFRGVSVQNSAQKVATGGHTLSRMATGASDRKSGPYSLARYGSQATVKTRPEQTK